MLELPKIPYKMEKNQRQSVALRGINFSNMINDGDIVDSKNISARAYPYLTTRKSRASVGDYSGVTAMTVFRGKFVVVKGNELIYDGQTIGKVMPGEKQFATINTKLVIMPDKVYLDGETMTLCPMGADVLCSTATFTKNSITIGNTSMLVVEGKGIFEGNTFTSATETVWDRRVDFVGSSLRLFEEITFVVTGKRTLRVDANGIDSAKFIGQQIYAYSGTSGENGPIYAYVGKVSSASYSGSLYLTIDRDVEYEVSNQVRRGKVFFTNTVDVGDELTFTLGGKTYTRARVTHIVNDSIILDVSTDDRVVVETSNIKRELMPDLTSVVEAGQTIFFSAGKFKDNVASVTHNTITMSSPFTISGEQYTEIYRERDSVDAIKVGDAIEISGGDKNNLTFVVDKIEGKTIYAENEVFEAAEMEKIFLKRKIPDFNFICESNNRLWGCVNAEHTIYASALGDPTNFFDYSGESTDSWAVAVGSEGDFTACCRYGGSVLFFKEMKLHKVLGSYPAEYSLYDYEIEGVQSGSNKSLSIINEVLYYKGIHGVFAFNGSPHLISQNFGDKEFGNAVAGNDGDTYYISMSDGERDYLFAYETEYDMWLLEDDKRVKDFARIGGNTYALCEGGEFFLCGAGESETDIEWHVQFAPLYETIDGKKSYSRIVFRLEIPRGSYLIVDVKTDDGAWREAGKVIGKRDGIVPVSIPINRCDKFELRLRGKGKATIHSMMREFFVGGDK
jgi:hypothetical protein